MTNDRIIRSAFHQSILAAEHHSSDTLVINELGLRNGQFRADIAVLNGKLVGYEIKTDQDTLNRLPGQIEAYNEVFDNIYIVTGRKHLDKVIAMVPEWWGIYAVNPEKKEINFNRIRKALKNQSQSGIGIAHLLWKDEVIELIQKRFRKTANRSHDKQKLYLQLISLCTTAALAKLALNRLKTRDLWRTDLK